MLVEQRVGDFIGEPCEGARYKFKQIESVWGLPSLESCDRIPTKQMISKA